AMREMSSDRVGVVPNTAFWMACCSRLLSPTYHSPEWAISGRDVLIRVEVNGRVESDDRIRRAGSIDAYHISANVRIVEECAVDLISCDRVSRLHERVCRWPICELPIERDQVSNRGRHCVFSHEIATRDGARQTRVVTWCSASFNELAVFVFFSIDFPYI